MSSAKRQRQSMIAGIRPVGITDSALAKIIGALKAHPSVLEAAGSVDQTRKDLGAHTSQILDQVSQAAELPLTAGGTLHWQIASPSKLLKLFLQSCPAFRDMFMLTAAATIAKHEPLSMILYHDEFTPGQVLKPDNKRKTTCFYFTFAQFGDFIRSEFAWIPCGALRHTTASLVNGGLSTAVKVVLRSFFFGAENFATGAVMTLADMGNTIVFAKLFCIIADESAIKHTYAVKGASGLLPCLKCKNVVLANHGILENDRSQYFVDISAIEGFDFTTDADLWEKYDKLVALKAGGANNAKLEQMEKVLGVNLVPPGVLGDLALREHIKPISDTAFDPMHCLFSNGIASQEMHLILEQCEQHLGISFSHMETWCKAGWLTQKHADRNAASAVFSARREAASKDGFKGIASELLAIFPLVRHFIEAVVRPRCPVIMRDALESFASLCQAVAMLNAMKRVSTNITRQNCDKLKATLATHLRLFQRAYGSDCVRPKHHLCQHLADQIFAHKLVIDCWPCERKHRSLKRLAGTIDNTRGFERSLLGRAIAEQVFHTPDDTFGFTLLGAQTAAAEMAAVLRAESVSIARSVRFGVVRLSVGDIIIADGKALRITACLHSDQDWCVLGSVYDFVRQHGAGVQWTSTNSIACFTLVSNSFIVPPYWNFQSDGLLLTLLDS